MTKVIINGSTELKVEQNGTDLLINGTKKVFDLKQLHPGSYHLLNSGVSYNVEVISSNPKEKKHSIRLNGKVLHLQLRDRYDDLLKELGMDASSSQRVGDLKAPMPGLVVNIPVKEGDQVKKGDTLVILEAMKMENALKATVDATVKKIAVIKGKVVEKNEVLIYLSEQ
ncbi:MAG: biotin/lipoyl-binding protein [Bacteroidetes bacterium]|nr:biotin/lipoyl-binding protein [Bacteroidota bacterium]